MEGESGDDIFEVCFKLRYGRSGSLVSQQAGRGKVTLPVSRSEMKLEGCQHCQRLERKTLPVTEYRDQQHQKSITEVFSYDDFWFPCAQKVNTIIPVAHLLGAMLSLS